MNELRIKYQPLDYAVIDKCSIVVSSSAAENRVPLVFARGDSGSLPVTNF